MMILHRRFNVMSNHLPREAGTLVDLNCDENLHQQYKKKNHKWPRHEIPVSLYM